MNRIQQRVKNWYFEKIKKAKIQPNVEIVMMGTEYGGWPIPKKYQIHKEDYYIGGGAGEDISFDCELTKNFLCKSIILDPTPRAKIHFEELCKAVDKGNKMGINGSTTEFYDIDKTILDNIKFVPFGMANKSEFRKFYFPVNKDWVSCSTDSEGHSNDYFEAQCYNYEDLLKELDIDYKNIKLIKLDIEGEEFGVIDEMIKKDMLPEILMFEIHIEAKSVFAIRKLIKALSNRMELYYAQGYDLAFRKVIEN